MRPTPSKAATPWRWAPLAGYDEATGDVTITVGKQEMTFAKKDIALVRLRVEF